VVKSFVNVGAAGVVIPLLEPLLEPPDPELDVTPELELDVTPELELDVRPELEPLVVPELLPVPLPDFPLLDRPASFVERPLDDPLLVEPPWLSTAPSSPLSTASLAPLTFPALGPTTSPVPP